MLKARCYRLAPLLFGGNHILVIFAQNICIRNCFFGLKMQNSPCPGRGTPPSQTLPPLGRFAHSQYSTSQITFGEFRRHGIYFFSYMSKISIWYFLIHDELLENCYEKNCHKSIQNKVDIALYRASRIPELPGPLSGPWTPAAIQGICFSPRGVDPGGGGRGLPPPNENIGGQTYRFAPPPPNNFDNLKN